MIENGRYLGLSESHLFMTDYDKIDLKYILGVSSVIKGNRPKCKIIAGTLCKLAEKRYIISFNVFVFLFIRDSFSLRYFDTSIRRMASPALPTGAAAPVTPMTVAPPAPAPASGATPSSSTPTSPPNSSPPPSFDMAKLDDPAFLDKIEKKDLAALVKGVASDNTDIRNEKRKLEDVVSSMKTGQTKLREKVDAQTTERLGQVWPAEITKAFVDKIYKSVTDPDQATDILVTVADNASTYGKQILATEKAIQDKKAAVHDDKRRAVEGPSGSKTNEIFAKESCDVIHNLLPAHLR